MYLGAKTYNKIVFLSGSYNGDDTIVTDEKSFHDSLGYVYLKCLVCKDTRWTFKKAKVYELVSSGLQNTIHYLPYNGLTKGVLGTTGLYICEPPIGVEGTSCRIDIEDGKYGNTFTVKNSSYFHFIERSSGGTEFYFTEIHGNVTIESKGGPKAGYKPIIHSPSNSSGEKPYLHPACKSLVHPHISLKQLGVAQSGKNQLVG